VGARMQAAGVKTAALIGSRNVMVESFYRKRLVAHGVTLLPPVMDSDEIDRIIYEELMQGRATRSAERTFKTLLTTMGRPARKRSCSAAPNSTWSSMSMPTCCRSMTAPRSMPKRRWTGSWAGSRAP
jgi:hypothetical protein